MIVVIDYGMGNIKSVINSLKKLKLQFKVSNKRDDIYEADGLILPGVGAFKDAIDNLSLLNLIEPIKEKVYAGTPILGICLGMQMLYEKGYEVEKRDGLGFLKGNIKIMEPKEKVKIPHIGWNNLQYLNEVPILKGLSNEPYMYFVHSFCATDVDEQELIATVKYGNITIPALVGRKNILGAQFHPEKSGEEGLKILKNFGEMVK